MAFRFRKAIRFGSGVWLNITKRGPNSVSIGRRGSMVNIGRGGVRETVGLPGTGLSYSTDKQSGSFANIILVAVAALGVFFTLIKGLFRWLWRP